MKLRTILTAIAIMLPIVRLPLNAAEISEDFASDPAAHGWLRFGNTNLFLWDSTNQNLRVIWDSAQTNSYFHHPLGTVLAHEDDFQLSFDLMFESYAGGVYPNRPGSMEAAIGLINLDDASRTNYSRGAGANSTIGPRNLMEFDFFPAFDIFLPTIAQTIIGTNSSPYADWGYDHANLQEMTPGQTFHVAMKYMGTNHTLTTVVSNSGAQYGPTQIITLSSPVDFRLTTAAICSYSHQNSFDSLLATGRVDNLHLVLPNPPVENLAGHFAGSNWLVSFSSQSNWLYALERTTNFAAWLMITTNTPGTGATTGLLDTNPPPGGASYRVRASRP